VPQVLSQKRQIEESNHVLTYSQISLLQWLVLKMLLIALLLEEKIKTVREGTN